jgi:hypothetical protein
MEYSDHWIMTRWHGEQWDFQNNEKTMEQSDHWIKTEWHGEQWYLQNNETMRHSDQTMTGKEININSIPKIQSQLYIGHYIYKLIYLLTGRFKLNMEI